MGFNKNIPGMPDGKALGILFSDDIARDLKAINNPQGSPFKAYPEISSYLSSVRWYPCKLTDVSGDALFPPADTATVNGLTIGGETLNPLITYKTPLEGRTAHPMVYQLSGEDVDGLLSQNFLDYTSTKVTLYLPFMGFYPLDITDLVYSNGLAKNIEIDIVIDILSGKATAGFYTSDTLLNTYEGKIGIDVSFGKNNAEEMRLNNLQTGASAAAGIVAGVGAAATGHPIGAAAAFATALGNSALKIAGNRPSITRGSIGDPLSALYMPLEPYLIIDRPQPYTALQPEYNHLVGRPAGYVAKLADLKGFTKVSTVHLDGIEGADLDELNTINDALKKGVIL